MPNYTRRQSYLYTIVRTPLDLRGSPRPSVVSMSFWRGGGRRFKANNKHPE